LIVWLNGAFGGGKTTTANELTALLPGARHFDPEWVGYMLRANLADLEFTDFQQLPPWRVLVPETMAQVAALTGQHLIAVQTVLVEDYWRELRSGLDRHSLPVSRCCWTRSRTCWRRGSRRTRPRPVRASGGLTIWPNSPSPGRGLSRLRTWWWT
jgi:hypothetical protein